MMVEILARIREAMVAGEEATTMEVAITITIIREDMAVEVVVTVAEDIIIQMLANGAAAEAASVANGVVEVIQAAAGSTTNGRIKTRTTSKVEAGLAAPLLSLNGTTTEDQATAVLRNTKGCLESNADYD